MGRKRIFARSCLAFALGAGAAPAWAETVVLQAQRDATLFEDDAGALANGAGQYLFVGRTWDENGIDALLRRALLRFDLAAVPPGAIVDAVRLDLTIDRVPPDATAVTMELHAVRSDWGEGASNAPGPEGRGTRAQAGDATWRHTFYDTGTWTAPGGDYDAAPVASAAVSSSPQALSFDTSPGLVAQVQAWVDDPAGNFGWILRGDEQFPQNARRLLSRENANPGVPTLTVEYTPAPEPPPEPPPEPEPAVPVPALGPAGGLLMVLAVLLGAGLRRRSR